MDTAKAKKALKKLTKQKGVSEGAVRREIEIAIAEAMKSLEPQAQAFWKSIPHNGEQPTPEEVTTYISG
ncbi:hypothetical protein [Clostridium kluyveri]|uniref:Sporulation initiation factor Spo0A C-terminal domain-containing protein n=1 Tax=Clostridium kluyveri (strain ATCC 8527 / DSM 555 / NBRC 12016 / NCIMB 10680 / K1) TaxID=431943 RepID=A5N190_CLOK5|nr:hypothetical protein [Clostridium kluyveri]EDK34886.1 Hypothetical protein CKL_2874 [Clostridium kluyveri DSM 555]